MSKRLLFTAFSGLLLASTALFGADSSNASEHVQVGTRAMSTEVFAAHVEARASMAAQNLTENGKPQRFAALAKSVSLNYTTHPGAYHSPVGISLFGDSIELEDGSIWSIRSIDTYIVRGWLPTDVIVITPNHSWFSSYNYKITNQNTGEYVSGDMFLGPVYTSPYTRWIAAIDYYNDIIYLDDGSIWEMSLFDSGIIDEWLIDDPVIIGVNDGWLSSTRPNILINVNMLNYAVGAARY